MKMAIFSKSGVQNWRLHEGLNLQSCLNIKFSWCSYPLVYFVCNYLMPPAVCWVGLLLTRHSKEAREAKASTNTAQTKCDNLHAFSCLHLHCNDNIQSLHCRCSHGQLHLRLLPAPQHPLHGPGGAGQGPRGGAARDTQEQCKLPSIFNKSSMKTRAHVEC